MTTQDKPKGPVLQGRLAPHTFLGKGTRAARSGGHRYTAEALCGHGVHPPETTVLFSSSEGAFAEGDLAR